MIISLKMVGTLRIFCLKNLEGCNTLLIMAFKTPKAFEGPKKLLGCL
jgi:hypothetical protein